MRKRTNPPLTLTLLALTLLAHGFVNDLAAFPEPALVSDAWRLDLEYNVPSTVAIPNDSGQTQWFWYVTYRVENNTGDDQLFIPEITVATDRGRVIACDTGVPSTVFQKVKQLVKNPLLERSSQIIGKILQGPDHAKDGVAIWAVPEEDIDAFSVFFAGFSGETQKIKHPVTGEPVLLRKTLMVDYKTPGTPDSPQDPTIRQMDNRWVMR